MNKTKKKYAFISYNHHDVVWAIRLKTKMIWFKLPSYITNEFKKSKYLEPVFRDRDYFTSGELTEMIKQQLDNSRYLIVICSPHSAKSEWVNREVDYFLNKKVRSSKEADPAHYIVPYVLLDEPFDTTECYPPALLEFIERRKQDNPDFNLLTIPKIDREAKLKGSLFEKLFPISFKTEKGFARVIAKVLGISDEFDDIWNLHLRLLRRRWIIRGVVAAFVIYAVSFLLYPVQLSVKVVDEPHYLPVTKDAMLYVNHIGYPLSKVDTTIVVNDLPWYYLFGDIPVQFKATYYFDKDTLFKSKLSHNNSIAIVAKRDSTFGVFSGIVKDSNGMPISGAIVTISRQKGLKGWNSMTDGKGRFQIHIPLLEQRETMFCTVSIDDHIAYERAGEVPYDSLILPVRH